MLRRLCWLVSLLCGAWLPNRERDRGASAGWSLTIAPQAQSSAVGTAVAIVLEVASARGDPAPDGTALSWNVRSAEPAGVMILAMDGATSNGRATLRYTNIAVGVDPVEVQVNSARRIATVEWYPGPPARVTVEPAEWHLQTGYFGYWTAAAVDAYDNPVAAGTPISWSVKDSPPSALSIVRQDSTTVGGRAQLVFTNARVGASTVTAVCGSVEGVASVVWHPGPPTGMSVEPASGSVRVGERHALVASVWDEHGNPVEDGTSVVFTVEGANPASLVAPTVDGRATCDYLGVRTGIDRVTVGAVGGGFPAVTAVVEWRGADNGGER